MLQGFPPGLLEDSRAAVLELLQEFLRRLPGSFSGLSLGAQSASEAEHLCSEKGKSSRSQLRGRIQPETSSIDTLEIVTLVIVVVIVESIGKYWKVWRVLELLEIMETIGDCGKYGRLLRLWRLWKILELLESMVVVGDYWKCIGLCRHV